LNRNGESGRRSTQSDDEGDKDMRVAIIDDEKRERDSLTEFMKRFSQEFHKRIDIVEFESGDRKYNSRATRGNSVICTCNKCV
jgi:hypothetical protein